MISKALFCKALRMIVEQEEINRKFAESLQMVGNGHYVFGTPNKYYDALLEVLRETVGDMIRRKRRPPMLEQRGTEAEGNGRYNRGDTCQGD